MKVGDKYKVKTPTPLHNEGDIVEILAIDPISKNPRNGVRVSVPGKNAGWWVYPDVLEPVYMQEKML